MGPVGEIDLSNMVGGSWQYQYDWFSFRASYFTADVTVPPMFAPGIFAVLPQTNPMAPPPPPGAPLVSSEVANAIIPSDAGTTFAGIAMKAEFDNWLIVAEYVNVEMDGSVFTDPVGSYITAAYTIGKWQPHITFEWFDTEPQLQILDLVDPADPVFVPLQKSINDSNEDRQVTTIGVRYNLNYATALKLDYVHRDYDVEITAPRPQFDAGAFIFSANFVF